MVVVVVVLVIVVVVVVVVGVVVVVPSPSRGEAGENNCLFNPMFYESDFRASPVVVHEQGFHQHLQRNI